MLPPGAPGKTKGKQRPQKAREDSTISSWTDVVENMLLIVITCLMYILYIYIYILNVHMWAYWGQMFCMNSRSLLTTLNKTCLILNPGLGNRSGHSLDVSLSIINGMLGLSKVGWTYCEGILNGHIWWCLCKNIHMTFWNPFAIHQNFRFQMSNFRKLWQMTRTYRILSNYIYIHIYLSNTWLPYQLGPRLHLRQWGESWWVF